MTNPPPYTHTHAHMILYIHFYFRTPRLLFSKYSYPYYTPNSPNIKVRGIFSVPLILMSALTNEM